MPERLYAQRDMVNILMDTKCFPTRIVTYRLTRQQIEAQRIDIANLADPLPESFGDEPIRWQISTWDIKKNNLTIYGTLPSSTDQSLVWCELHDVTPNNEDSDKTIDDMFAWLEARLPNIDDFFSKMSEVYRQGFIRLDETMELIRPLRKAEVYGSKAYQRILKNFLYHRWNNWHDPLYKQSFYLDNPEKRSEPQYVTRETLIAFIYHLATIQNESGSIDSFCLISFQQKQEDPPDPEPVASEPEQPLQEPRDENVKQKTREQLIDEWNEQIVVFYEGLEQLAEVNRRIEEIVAESQQLESENPSHGGGDTSPPSVLPRHQLSPDHAVSANNGHKEMPRRIPYDHFRPSRSPDDPSYIGLTKREQIIVDKIQRCGDNTSTIANLAAELDLTVSQVEAYYTSALKKQALKRGDPQTREE